MSTQPYPAFRLRFDWPFEVGFVDQARVPVTADAYARFQLKPGDVLSLEDVATYNSWRAGYQPPHTFVYGSWVLRGERDPTRLIWDGHAARRIQCDGLWRDLIERARAACAAKPDGYEELFSPRDTQPLDRAYHPGESSCTDATPRSPRSCPMRWA